VTWQSSVGSPMRVETAMCVDFHCGHDALPTPKRSPDHALGWEILLVVGLGVMIYGALYNLVLGANGFTGGFKGNTNGLLLWAVAAAVLIFVRGPFERALIRLPERRQFPVVREALYVAGAFAFIVGERSVISGKAPTLATGAAFPIALLIILAAAFLLVPIRLAAKPAELGQPEPHVVEAAGAEA